MEDKTTIENSSEISPPDTDSQEKWEKIKKLLFGTEYEKVADAIQSTNDNLSTIDETIRSEVKAIRGFITNTIRYETELLSQDVISKEIITEEKLSSFSTVLEQLEKRIINLEERLKHKDEAQKKIQKTLDRIDETLKQINKLHILKHDNT